MGIGADVMVDDPVAGLGGQVLGQVSHERALALAGGTGEEDGAEVGLISAEGQGRHHRLAYLRAGQEVLQPVVAEGGMGQVALRKGAGDLVGGEVAIELGQQVVGDGLAEDFNAGVAVDA